MKINRKEIWLMFDKRCAYCGCELKDESGKYMQVDHVKAVRRNEGKFTRPENDDMKYPACIKCNKYKDVMNIDVFREQIKLSGERLKVYAAYNNAVRFGMIEFKEWDGLFYFEKFNT